MHNQNCQLKAKSNNKTILIIPLFLRYSPGNDVDISSINANMGAVWVKIVSAWLCTAIYLWTLAAPILLPDRDFSV